MVAKKQKRQRTSLELVFMAKKKEDIPNWVSDEIQNAKFKKPEKLKRAGYILEIYDLIIK